MRRPGATFELIGEAPKAEQCPGIDGIQVRRDEYIRGGEAVAGGLDLFLAGAGARAERYEIAATRLITMAQR